MIIKDFKGLYTNHDTKDLNPEFLRKSQNAKYYQGYIGTQFYKLDVVRSDVEGTPILIDTVYLDNDKLAVDSEFNSIYIPEIKSYKLLITRKNTATGWLYMIYLDDGNGYEYIPLNTGLLSRYDYDVNRIDKEPFIYNTNGIVKIFLPHISLWLGKINRYYRGNEITNYNGFYLDLLMESYSTKSIQDNEIINGRLFVPYVPVIFYDGAIDAQTGGTMLLHHIEPIQGGQYRYFTLQNAEGNLISPMDDGDYFKLTFTINGNSVIVTAQRDQYFVNNVAVIYPITGMFQDLGAGENKIKVGEYTSTWDNGAYGIENNWNFSEAKTVADSGFDMTKPEFQILTTCILDDNSEFVIETRSLKAKKFGATKFAVRLDNVYMPINISKRITAFAFYIKFKNQTDYQQISLIRLQAKIFTSYSTLYLYPLKFTGIYLIQTIGKLFNEYNHKLIDTFDDYIEIAGVSYSLRGTSIYYPAVGNGQILKDVFYNTSIIPELYNETVIKLSNLNDYLAVHTVKGTKLIVVKNSQYGSFLFFTKDSLGYNIRKKQDVVEAYDGIGILTNRGIYITNGQNDFLLSEQINDIVEANYQKGIIFYDTYEKQFYFFIMDQDDFYLFDIKDKKWTQISLKSEGNLKRVYNTIDAIYLQYERAFYKLVKRDTGSAIITTQKINLGNPKTYKIFQEINLDFEGEINYAGNNYVNKSRDITIIPIPIASRIPTESLDFTFVLKNSTKLFSIGIEAEEEAEII